MSAPGAGFAGRRVLVVGAGGIGAQVCRDLAAAGAAVFFTYAHRAGRASELVDELRSSPEVAAAGGACAGSSPLDVADDAACSATVDAAASALGGLDTLVVTAGHRHGLRLFHETTADEAAAVVGTELLGVMNCVRHVLPRLRGGGLGRIVLVGSDSGKTGSLGDAASSAARGGLIAFAKSVARETARADITVNVVCPGPTDTALLAGLGAAEGLTGKVMGAIVKSVPKGRVGVPAEVAAAVVFLARADAGFVTGQAISVSGGLTMQ